MVNIFDEDSGMHDLSFRIDPEDFDDNESAKLASMHEGDILNEDGSFYRENEGFQAEEEGEADTI